MFFKINPIATGESTKLQPKSRGPLVIIEVLPSDTYRVANLKNDSKGRRYTSTAHATQLRIWKPQIDRDDENEVFDLETK